jgi:hypothetical protein
VDSPRACYALWEKSAHFRANSNGSLFNTVAAKPYEKQVHEKVHNSLKVVQLTYEQNNHSK